MKFNLAAAAAGAAFLAGSVYADDAQKVVEESSTSSVAESSSSVAPEMPTFTVRTSLLSRAYVVASMHTEPGIALHSHGGCLRYLAQIGPKRGC
jgi:hypothetical protein